MMMNLTSASTPSVTAATDDGCTTINKTIGLLNSTIPLVWLIVGTITNGLSLIVFSRRTMRRNSTFFYLAIMTLSDFIVIWLCPLRDFLAYKFHIYISGALFCKLHVFAFFVSCQFSSWLLTAANFDRLIYVVSYQHSGVWCTKRTAIRVTCVLLFILMSFNAHFLLFVESDPAAMNAKLLKVNESAPASINQYVYPFCTLKRGDYVNFYNKYYSWLDAFVFSFIPFIIMSICNAALIHRVFSTKRNINRNTRRQTTIYKKNNAEKSQNQLQNNNNESESQAGSRKVSFVPTMADSTSISQQLNNHNSQQPKQQQQQQTIKPTLSAFFNNNKDKESSPFLSVNERSASVNCLKHTPSLSLTENNNYPDTNLSSLNTSVNVYQQQQQQPTSKSGATSVSEAAEKMRNMALTIIGVTLLFTLFTVPINIYLPVINNLSSGETKCEDLIFCLLNNMVNANHSINFFIYLVTNSKFKKEIRMLFGKFRFLLSHRHLSILVCCLTCGYVNKVTKLNENETAELRNNLMKMREKTARQDRAVSGTSFAADATYGNGNTSRTNSQYQLDRLSIANLTNNNSATTTANSNSNKMALNFLSSSSLRAHKRTNSNPTIGQRLSPASSSVKLGGKSAAAHQHKIPEINLMEVSENSTTNNEPSFAEMNNSNQNSNNNNNKLATATRTSNNSVSLTNLDESAASAVPLLVATTAINDKNKNRNSNTSDDSSNEKMANSTTQLNVST